MRLPATIFDFHGTLADTSGIAHLAESGQWEEFFIASLNCPPNERVVAATMSSHALGYANVLYTGMSEIYREGFIDWLIRYGVPVDSIRMRPEGDFRKDFLLKGLWYNEDVARFEFRHAWEDSPPVIDLWKGLSIPVTEIPSYRNTPVS